VGWHGPNHRASGVEARVAKNAAALII
jgi:hypothetical protein